MSQSDEGAREPVASRDEEVIANGDEEKPPSDEEEGEDVFDSSDDEEGEDDADEERKVREGFIVDDEDEDVVTGKGSKKRRRHKRRAKEQDDDGRLSEDDLDLLMENAGVKRSTDQVSSGKLKRLKRAGQETSADEKSATASKEPTDSRLEDFFSDEEGEDELAGDDERRSGERANGADEGDHRGDRENNKGGILDELDDFIEDDDFSDEDEETRQQRIQERKMLREQRMKQPVMLLVYPQTKLTRCTTFLETDTTTIGL